jgi:acyl transferase domain-containing protein/NAD(P)-dependent dehydrogenase (short-subunit alcohol dehydrogenase family)/acyl-CoA thioesterase FadM
MAFFAMPYRVLFQDTMAYGSHHFLTNFKFQCEVREHFFFALITDPNPDDKALQDLVLLTQDGYSRNLAPVFVGQRVGLLLTIEEHTRSSVRMCFRVVRQDGKPVCCGHQTMVCTSRQSGNVILAPPPLLYACAQLREKLRGPSFQERVLSGGSALKAIFDEEVIQLGTAVAHESGFRLAPDIIKPPPLHTGQGGQSTVLLFPGQGSWEPKLLREVVDLDPTARALVAHADEISRSLLGAGLLGLAREIPDETILARHPDLVQVSSFLTSVLCARYLMANGVMPHLLLGHSAGELAALAVAGAYDLPTGLELVCRRVAALQSVKNLAGGMVALSCDERKARILLEEAAAGSLEITVINHAEQTVVSGTSEDLERLTTVARTRQVRATLLKSRYPFHSQLLREAVAPFETALRKLRFQALGIPVYSPLARGLLARQPDLAADLPRQFVQHLFLPDALEDTYALGGRHFIECGGGRVLTGLVQRTFRDWPEVTADALSTEAASGGIRQTLARLNEKRTKVVQIPALLAADLAPETKAAPEATTPLPIAIVSLGCVLPGVANPDALWDNLLAGKSGIVDVAQLDPIVAADFRCERPVRPDKTYSLLSGRADASERGAAGRYYSPEEWARLPAVARFLAIATAQCQDNLRTAMPSPKRVHCYLGSTGDGSADYDEVFLVAAAEEEIRAGTAPEPGKEQFCQALEQILGRTLKDAGERVPYRSYLAVVQRLLGAGAKVLAVDAACASSLYAIDLGLRALRDGQCDVAICGGTFAPGVSNTCLFAQFQGLSATGSRPLDATADGVVFGEGAALLVLKRLPDALAAGDTIRAIIRSVGTSSDGKSPSVMEPRKNGQVLAMRRAALRCGIDPATLQYIDAHATGTPVGDAVEFASLCEAVGTPVAGRAPIRLGSLKGLLGHTGWAAGAASVIALCKALEHHTLPPQPNFTTPNPHFGIEGSPFAISAQPAPWPGNADGLPRRAGVNGFGFGGCDAHLILEEYKPGYHRPLCATSLVPPPSGQPIALIAFTSFFPANRDSTIGGRPWLFSPAEVRLPAKVRILPDVADHMDRSHILAVRAAAETAASMSRHWENLFVHTDYRPETGIVVGFAGKTRRGIEASLRVYFDHVLRRLGELRSTLGQEGVTFDRARDDFMGAVRRITPSGPYTLPGLMPNVMAGRVANAFHLTGPNMVLDADQLSLYEVLREAERLLRFGECKVVLAGAVSACAGPDVDRVLQSCSLPDPRPTGEAAVVLALVSPTMAQLADLPVLAYLSLSAAGPVESLPARVYRVGTEAPVRLQGAEGAFELTSALELIQHQGGAATVQWADSASNQILNLTITREKPAIPQVTEVHTAAPSVKQVASSAPATAVVPASPAPATMATTETVPDEVASLLAVPVRWTTPQWVPQDATTPARSWSLDGLHVLVLTDQPAWVQAPEFKAALSKLHYRIVCPSSVAAPDAIAIDLASSAAMEQSLRQLDETRYDAVLLLKDLRDLDPVAVTRPDQFCGSLLDLLFAVARHGYSRLEKSELCIGAVCLHAMLGPRVPHPFTGLVSGFLRSLARELPKAICKQVNLPGDALGSGLALLEVELRQSGLPAATEISYIGDLRHIEAFVEVNEPATGGPMLGPESVVLAVGGARGITAVLAEVLLRRFGCTVLLLGRTDPDAVPAELRTLDDDAFERFEPEFYRRELAKGPGARMPELKQRYAGYRSAREAAENLRMLASLPGKVKYLRADITDPAAVDAAIQWVAKECGRLDLVLHGAGIQTSKVLNRKKLEEFRAILTTKLGGLGNLIQACRRRFPQAQIHLHPITSSFSQIGNAGQPDYGAANLAMDRVAQHLATGADSFKASSLGWLGWLRVGMTRGSEYATLAIARRLRPIPRAEGAKLFEQFVSGRPVGATLHLMSDLEAQAFQLTIQPAQQRPQPESPPQDAANLVRTWDLAPETHPFLRDHQLNGTPTMPGAYAVELAVRTVLGLRPKMYVHNLSNVSIERFIKFPEERPFLLRAEAEVIEETRETARIRMRFLSDFVHANGQVLQKDIVHFSADFLLTTTPRSLTGQAPLGAVQSGWQVPDPYLHPAGPLLMNGAFRSLHDIRLGSSHSTAVFRPRELLGSTALVEAVVPFVLLDGLWRFSAMRREEDGTAVLCVPLRCGRLDILPDVNHQTLANQECTLVCNAPRLDDQHVYVDWAEARDASGRVLFVVKDIVGRIYGQVPAQAEPLSPEPVVQRTNGTTGSHKSAPANGSPQVAREQILSGLSDAIALASSGRSLEGKIALVTGSGRGIGRVIALGLAKLGAQVIVNSFHSRDKGDQTTAEALALGGKAVHLWGSVANLTHLKRIFQEIDSRFGRLDYFISNASAGIFAPLTEVTPELWDRCFRTNVIALHQGSLLAAELMRRRGGGKIVALSSVGAQLCFDFFGCVGPVKAAVESLVRYLAVELSPDGIQVNTVTAGPVVGELLDFYEPRPRWERLVPRQHLLIEEEVVDPIVYLLTHNSMNGASLVLDAAGSLRLCEPVS